MTTSGRSCTRATALFERPPPVLWLAAHQDESYYMCSDVNFQGGTTPPPTPSPSPSSTASPSPTTPTPPTPGTCQVEYAVDSWNTGLTAAITITNTGSSAINGWMLDFTLPSGQTITNGWNATYTPTSGTVTASNAAWNATISPGTSVSVGFQATYTGDASEPTSFALNGTTCTST